MANSWFKFYGQDWMTDVKVISLSNIDRLCFITLLCLASASRHDDYHFEEMSEDTLFDLTHLRFNPLENDIEYAYGVLDRLLKLKMITRHVINDTPCVVITHFRERQESNLTGYERIKRYREKAKQSEKENDNINDNAMITLEKIREEKKRKDINISSRHFVPPTLADVEASIETLGYVYTDPAVFFNYYESKDWVVGKVKMKNWKSALAGWEARSRPKNIPTSQIVAAIGRKLEIETGGDVEKVMSIKYNNRSIYNIINEIQFSETRPEFLTSEVKALLVDKTFLKYLGL